MDHGIVRQLIRPKCQLCGQAVQSNLFLERASCSSVGFGTVACLLQRIRSARKAQSLLNNQNEKEHMHHNLSGDS